MPLTRKATLILDMIAIVIIFVVATVFFVAFSGNGSTALSGILGDWFSSVHAPQIGKPDIVTYGECPSTSIRQCSMGNAMCRIGAPRVTVSNNGESDISKNLTFLICVDLPGSIAKTQLQEVSGLRIGQEKTFNFVTAGIGGDYSVDADCQDQVAESDKSNNIITLNCPAESLVNCYVESTAWKGTTLACPSYCNNYPSGASGGQTCGEVNAVAYPDKLITLTDCGTCPSDKTFEGGCYCPYYCKDVWNKQTAPGTSCGGKLPEMGSFITNCYASCTDGLLCGCDKGCDPEKEGRVSYIPREAQGCTYWDPTQILSDCTTTCVADNYGRGCFCPMTPMNLSVTMCGGKPFVLPGENCAAAVKAS